MHSNIFTVSAILNEAEIKLKNQGIQTFALDSQLLLSRVLNLNDIGDLLLKLDVKISPIHYNKYTILLNRRLKHEPIAYIVGSKNFWNQKYIVDKNVLIPRPETELIIEVILKRFSPTIDYKFNILDLGTGSGCIILSLLSELKFSIGIGVDHSQKALHIAQLNAIKLQMNKRVKFLVSNWFDSLDTNYKFDIIISNPPYIHTDEWLYLDKSVKDFEPKNALTDNKDGLENYRIIAKDFIQFLKRNGILILEIGYNQKNKIKQIFQIKDYKIQFLKDLQNITRIAILKK